VGHLPVAPDGFLVDVQKGGGLLVAEADEEPQFDDLAGAGTGGLDAAEELVDGQELLGLVVR
jgi:hypothetical protein